MKLLFFGFSLNKNSQLLLPLDGEKTKNQMLAEVLESDLEYQFYSKIVYKFNQRVGHFVIGEIGRKSTKTISIPSSSGFQDIKNDHYPHSKIIFNVSENYAEEQGHMVAFEYRSDLFKNPEAQIHQLETQLNIKLQAFGYAISFYPLFDESNFWSFVKRNEGKIEKLTFTYSVPNFLGLKNSLTDDLRAASENYGITNTTVVLENKNGSLIINEEDKLIKESIEYASQGAGEFRIKAKGLKVEFTSKKNIKTISADEIEINANTESALQNLFNKLK